ncbi:MAG: tRNA pseudouridine(38-40) synthase TruA [Acidobacteriota bacterium]|nr:tRNA pseudouridine(38-40) synthase TruA [Acidobacteriota bacterium]
MPVFKAILAYDGGPFHGWQVQPGLTTVQGTLAEAIHHVTGLTVLPQGSGRTDTGVHALGQVASFALNTPIPAENLHRALNRVLPRSIRVLQLQQMPDGFHARHSAVGKTYEYRILPTRVLPGPYTGSPQHTNPQAAHRAVVCSPFLAPWVWDFHLPLDLELLQQAAQAVVGTHDFTSFAATRTDLSARAEDAEPPNNVRTLYSSQWLQQDGLLLYRVSGNGFLYHMVRNLVGTQVEIGSGRLPADQMPAILAARTRSAAGPTAPARGLFLVEVAYP